MEPYVTLWKKVRFRAGFWIKLWGGGEHIARRGVEGGATAGISRSLIKCWTKIVSLMSP